MLYTLAQTQSLTAASQRVDQRRSTEQLVTQRMANHGTPAQIKAFLRPAANQR